MANPLRGEVELQTPEKTYTMRMSINAIVSIEDHFGMGINEISEMLGDVEKMRMKNVRTVVFYALQDRHPDVTEEEAGEAMSQAGLAAVTKALSAAMASAFPEAAKPDGADNPRKAKRAGTGNAS